MIPSKVFDLQYERLCLAFNRPNKKEQQDMFHEELNFMEQKDFIVICNKILQQESKFPTINVFMDLLPDRTKYLKKKAKWYTDQVNEIRTKENFDADKWNEERIKAGKFPVNSKESYFRMCTEELNMSIVETNDMIKKLQELF